MRGGARLGRYWLTERIAAGGMAEVYLARMEGGGGLAKTVVIKTILPQLTTSPEMRAMLLDEARIGFALRHQNVAQVLDVGSADGTLYVAIEHVDGMDLARLLRALAESGSPLDPELACFIGVELLRALDYAHRRTDDRGEPLGIVHRDVSPHNVLISTEGEVKLTDFGIARTRDRLSKTTTGSTKGKLAYMAPEQLNSGPVDHRVDLFGVGATLYEVLSGQPPFSGASEVELLQSAQRGEIEPLRQRRPELDERLSAVVDWSLARIAAERPASARAMSEPLEALLPAGANSAQRLAELIHWARQTQRQAEARHRAFERAILGGETTGAGGTGDATEASGAVLGTASAAPTRLMPRGNSPAGMVAHDQAKPALTRDSRGRPALIGGLALAAAVALSLILWPPRCQSETGVGGGGSVATGPAAAGDPGPRPTGSTDPAKAEPRPSGADSGPVDAPRDRSEPPPPEPPATPAPAPARRPSSGRLTVRTLPWSQVSIDGKAAGTTPLDILLRPGKHTVRMHNPQTGQSATRVIRIRAGKKTDIGIRL